MIREEDLRELVEFDGEKNPVLSLYLDVDPRHQTVEQYKLVLRSLFDSQSDIDPTDKERVERYIDFEYDRQARGLVCFSCQAQQFWRAYALHVPVENAIMVDRRPLVRRLIEVMNTYGDHGVVAIDRLGARYFTFHLGLLEEAEGIIGEEVKRHKQGGRAAARYQRHEDEAAMANLRNAAELTEQYARQYKWQRIVLAGTDSNVARFQEMLPDQIRKLVVGTTPLEINSSIQEVRERAEQIALEAHQAYELQLAEDLIVVAAKTDQATLGLAETLDALQSGRVYHLLFSEDYTVAEDDVLRCTACHYLTVQQADACPLCGSALEPMADVINTIARRAIGQDAQVTILPAQNPLQKQGEHLGAFLRF